jgi:hypothetical protein
MKKKFLTIFIMLLLLQTQLCLAKVFNQDTLPVDPNNVPDALSQYQVKDEAKGIFQKIAGEWKKINDWGVGIYTKKIEPKFGKYVNRVVDNIKQGWGEEKAEYRQDFFKTLGSLWERIKNFVFHKQGS